MRHAVLLERYRVTTTTPDRAPTPRQVFTAECEVHRRRALARYLDTPAAQRRRLTAAAQERAPR